MFIASIGVEDQENCLVIVWVAHRPLAPFAYVAFVGFPSTLEFGPKEGNSPLPVTAHALNSAGQGRAG